MAERLCEFELEVLRGLAGTGPSVPWGAAVGCAIEVLRKQGLIALDGYTYRATAEGKRLVDAE